MSKRTTVRVSRLHPPPAILEGARRLAVWVAADIARGLKRRSKRLPYYFRRPAELLDCLTGFIESYDDVKAIVEQGRRSRARRRARRSGPTKSFAE